jgi:hypothetical protein
MIRLRFAAVQAGIRALQSATRDAPAVAGASTASDQERYLRESPLKPSKTGFGRELGIVPPLVPPLVTAGVTRSLCHRARLRVVDGLSMNSLL